MSNRPQIKEILFFTTDITIKAGIERITVNLANFLVSRGLRVRIVSNFKTNQTPAYRFNENIRFDFLTGTAFPAAPGSLSRFMLFIKNIRRVREYFLPERNAVIIAQAFPNAFVLSLCRKCIKNNTVFAAEHVCYSYYNKIIRMLRLSIYKKFSGVVVLTPDDYKYYLKRETRVFLIPNGIEMPPSGVEIAPRFRGKTIVSIGRFSPPKNFGDLIRVFAEIHKKHPDWNLVIYGEGEERPLYEKLIKDLALETSAALPGLVDDVNVALQKSSIFAVTSLFEGFSIVLVEAMSNGLACVSYDCPYGPGTIITNNEDGYLIETGNRGALYDCICYLIDNPAIRERIGAAAREGAKRFDIDSVGKQWLDLFEKVEPDNAANNSII